VLFVHDHQGTHIAYRCNTLPSTPHVERHFTSGDAVRDIVIGMSDGVTVPFALAAGLSGAVQAWVDFMMRFELGLEVPDPKRALISAGTIAGAHIAGGLIPLAPYFMFAAAGRALTISVAFTLLALFAFGCVKGHFTGARPLRSALETTLVGGFAAAAAFGIADLIS
jgi:vacuolar iron transporter family protein